MTKIEVCNVVKTIRNNTVVDDITVSFDSGKIYGLKGINGSGKTMLMRLICGLIRPTKGSILINGKMLWRDITFPESIGILLENPAFLDFYSGRENEAFQMVLPFIENYYGYIAGVFERDTSLKGDTAQRKMYAVGFTGVLNHHIMTASYGMLENEMFKISDETTREVVRQFLYGIYS